MNLSNSFDVVRLCAALLVVYGHSFPLTAAGAPQFLGNSVQAIGVKIFFVISGYLIVGSWMRDQNILRFASRRALRILPALVVVVVLTALVLGPLLTSLPLRDYFFNSRVLSYLANILFRPQYDLPGLFKGNPYPGAVNGSLWSLAAEVAMYVIGPLAFSAGLLLRSPRLGVACAAAILMALSTWFVRVAPPAATPVFYGSSVLSFLDVAPYFVIGSMYAVMGWSGALNLGTACAGWMALTLLQPPGVWSELAMYVVLPYAVLSLGTQSSRVGSWLTKRGDISYGVYLYGFPLQQCVAALVPAGASNSFINAALTLPPLLLAATLSWLIVERPMLRFKPRASKSAARARTQEMSTSTP